jgi:transposase-like protein
MKAKNIYRNRARFWVKLSRKIIKYFSMDLTATQTSKLLLIERKTINDWYNYLRESIYWFCENERNEVLNWTIEMDESYFWAKRVKWKRWRWAWWKIKVFWLLKRNWRVYTEIVPDVTANTLTKIIQGKIDSESILNTDRYRSYDWLVHLWYWIHHRVNHSENEFARWSQHINWIESFWSFAKRRLIKFNWVQEHKFLLHLKETEFRFNCWLQKKVVYNELVKVVKEYAIFIS